MTRFLPAALVVVALAVPTGAALAHHGWAWTTGGNLELTGVIAEARLGNPHGLLEVDVEGERWIVEVGQPWRNERAGLDGGRSRPRGRDPCRRRARGRRRRQAAQGRAPVHRRPGVPALPRARLTPWRRCSPGSRPPPWPRPCAPRAGSTPPPTPPTSSASPCWSVPSCRSTCACWASGATCPRVQLVRVLVPVAATGLALAVAAGALLFSARATEYAGVGFLQVKLALVLSGTAAALAVHWRHGFLLVTASDGRLAGHALVSLACWPAALVCGRLIAFAAD